MNDSKDDLSKRVLQYLTKKSAELNAIQTGISFQSSDNALQRLFDAAEAKAAENIVQFNPAMKVLVEGGGFQAAYLETQPMGGEMYAKRNLEIALNNQYIAGDADFSRAEDEFPFEADVRLRSITG